MLTLGFDVGVTGAFAAINEQGEFVSVHDLPIMCWGKTKWIDGIHLLGLIRATKNGQPARAFVEQVGPMPKLGTVAANSKGLTLGSTLVALQFAGVPIELVAPATWKRALGLINPGASDTEKKLASRSRAQMLFPNADLDRAKDHNRAEALLIAHYGQRLAKPAQVAA
ncbi:MAG TPA: hypothetical protein VI653_21000 [Steroidobacteraceae bacterium]